LDPQGTIHLPSTRAGELAKRVRLSCLFGTGATCVAASTAFVATGVKDESSPIFGVTIPPGYRERELIAVSHEAGLEELRGIVGNPIAIRAYRSGALPFPDGE
jgi:hypothetical protein